jgi:predicted enzyme related to lactoylglutathione lyase
MPNYKYSHEHLMSPDPQKTADSYIKMFGAKTDRVVKRPSGEVTIFLNLNGTTIVISEKSQPPFGQDHFGIATDNIETTVKDLKAAGYKFTMEITAINPKTKIAYFQGPDNALIELVEE